jgi:hypothetical protein
MRKHWSGPGVALVAVMGCADDLEHSAPMTSAVQRVQSAHLQGCQDAINAVLSDSDLRKGAAPDADVAAIATDAFPRAWNGDPTTAYPSPWRNHAALVDESKTEMIEVRQRCAEQVPQCPSVGSETVSAISAVFDEHLQRAFDYETDLAGLIE